MPKCANVNVFLLFIDKKRPYFVKSRHSYKKERATSTTKKP